MNESNKIAAKLVLSAALLVVLAACEREEAPSGDPGMQAAAVQDHDEEEEHRGHDDEAGHGEAGHEDEAPERDGIALTAGQAQLAEIRSEPVEIGEVPVELQLPAEMHYNENRLAHITPRVEGVVAAVRKTLGDRVEAGELLAVLESRELAEVKSAYLAAQERIKLTRALFERERELWEKKITAEQDYLNAELTHNEARIALRTAEKQLHALGLKDRQVAALTNEDDPNLAQYEVRAPFAGEVVEWHLTQGERVGPDDTLYTIADLSKVWVMAAVYEQDLSQVKTGQRASVAVKAYPGVRFAAEVTWVSSSIDEETRTLPIRLEIDNSDGRLTRGMFAEVTLGVSAQREVLSVPATALRSRQNEPVVFVDRGDGSYELRDVTVGARSAGKVAITEGLRPGERVVTSGSFVLLSELEKSGFTAGHAH